MLTDKSHRQESYAINQNFDSNEGNSVVQVTIHNKKASSV